MRQIEKTLRIFVVLAIVIVAIVQGYLYWQIKEVQKEIQVKEKKIATLTSRIGELQAKKATIPKLQAFFSSLDQKLLLQKEAKQYVDSIANTLDKNSGGYSLKVAGVEQVADKYEIVYINISFSAENYSYILNVIKAIESQKKWSEISSAPSINNSGKSYSVSFTITLPYVTDIADTMWDIK